VSESQLVIEAVRRSVTVDCVVEEAFRIFTTDAMSWWPVATHSIHGDAVQEVVFEGREGGEIYELTADGVKGHWATVVSWEPPSRIVLAWNILEREAVATEVDVRFVAEGDRTRVELEHRGWEAIAEDAAEKRDSYDNGWGKIVEIYRERIA
jgi:uncharacterized protein YndB with AHSA1/START domain